MCTVTGFFEWGIFEQKLRVENQDMEKLTEVIMSDCSLLNLSENKIFLSKKHLLVYLKKN